MPTSPNCTSLFSSIFNFEIPNLRFALFFDLQLRNSQIPSLPQSHFLFVQTHILKSPQDLLNLAIIQDIAPLLAQTLSKSLASDETARRAVHVGLMKVVDLVLLKCDSGLCGGGRIPEARHWGNEGSRSGRLWCVS
ncbi:hypothetical protein PS2_011706 [Malus domestica]